MNILGRGPNVTSPISPFFVDSSRMGGNGATLRHGFNASQRGKPRIISPPPPKRRGKLGEGRFTPPSLSQAQKDEIQAQARSLIEALALELEEVKLESDLVSGSTLRSEPDAYKSIEEVGIYFTPQEIRTQLILDAQAIEGEANRVLKGSLASYLDDQDKQELSTVLSDAKALVGYLEQFDLSPISGANTRISEEHVASHISLIRGAIEEIEKGVVTGEAGSVPVREPSEKTSGLGSLLAVGILIAVTAILVDSI